MEGPGGRPASALVRQKDREPCQGACKHHESSKRRGRQWEPGSTSPRKPSPRCRTRAFQTAGGASREAPGRDDGGVCKAERRGGWILVEGGVTQREGSQIGSRPKHSTPPTIVHQGFRRLFSVPSTMAFAGGKGVVTHKLTDT